MTCPLSLYEIVQFDTDGRIRNVNCRSLLRTSKRWEIYCILKKEQGGY